MMVMEKQAENWRWMDLEGARRVRHVVHVVSVQHLCSRSALSFERAHHDFTCAFTLSLKRLQNSEKIPF